MLSVFAALAMLERKTIWMRQLERIETAIAIGKYNVQKPNSIDDNWKLAEYAKWRSDEQTAR